MVIRHILLEPESAVLGLKPSTSKRIARPVTVVRMLKHDDAMLPTHGRLGPCRLDLGRCPAPKPLGGKCSQLRVVDESFDDDNKLVARPARVVLKPCLMRLSCRTHGALAVAASFGRVLLGVRVIL